MTAVALITLAVLALSLGIALSIAVVRGDNRADQLLEERAAHTTTRARLERSDFELKSATVALDAANKRIAALSAAVEKRIDEPIDSDLHAGAVDERSVRAAIRAKAAAARRSGEVPAEASHALRTQTDPAKPGSAEVLPAGSLDPNELLR